MFVQNVLQSKSFEIFTRIKMISIMEQITLKANFFIFILFFWCLWIDFLFFWWNSASVQHTNKANLFKYKAKYYNYPALEDLIKLLRNKTVIRKNMQRKWEREFNQKGKMIMKNTWGRQDHKKKNLFHNSSKGYLMLASVLRSRRLK